MPYIEIKKSVFYEITKRVLDILASLILLIIFSPVIVVVSIAIKLDSSGPVLADTPERVGRNGNPFKMYKFRSMVQNAHDMLRKNPKFSKYYAEYRKGSYKLKDDPRITNIGHFIRKHSLDEVPQFFNILNGEMSLVGPRAEVPEIVTLYNEEQKKVLSVKPGMVDYASLEFRKEGEIMSSAENLYQTYTQKIMPEKLKLSLKYINEKSLWLDFKLIIKTLFRIISDII